MWSAEFVEMLGRKRIKPRYRLESVPMFGYAVGGINVHSHPGRFGTSASLMLEGSSISAGVLHPGDWNTTFGTLNIGIRSGIDHRRSMPRGSLARLMVGFDGWGEDAYQPVFIGQLQDLTWAGTHWGLQFRSLVGSLQGRFARAPGQRLFADLQQTTLSSSYTPGDTTIDLTDTSGLDKLSTGEYLILITPDSGDQFFLTGTGKTATEMTGATTTGQLGTTAAAASSGNRVDLCAYLELQPAEIALTLLTSTGNANNGVYDLGPETWGYAIPAAHVDIDDSYISTQIAKPTSGAPVWDVYSVAALDDGGSWLRGLLAPAGMWLCERQGALTVRAADAPGAGLYELAAILDSEIVEIRSYNAWDPAQPVEYSLLQVSTAGNSSISSTDDVESRPSIFNRVAELPWISQNESAWRDRLIERLARWAQVVPEAIEIVVAGWRLAGLCPGDLVLLRSRFFSLRAQQESVMMVVSCEPDWFGATVTIRCVHQENTNLWG